MEYIEEFLCSRCRLSVNAADRFALCKSCGGFIRPQYAVDRLRKTMDRDAFLRRDSRLLHRWRELLPVGDPRALDHVWLGERETPMLRWRNGGSGRRDGAVYLKLDCQLPTGSLKDRPLTLVTANAMEEGRRIIAISSSGNAAASLAAHARRAGLRAVVVVFHGVSAAKMRKVMAYGPALLVVPGGMDDAEKAARDCCEAYGWLNAEAFVNPLNLEGEKTIALEIAAQFEWDPPETVVLPAGNGACIVASYLGFHLLHTLGWIPAMPRLVGVQFDACNPVARAFREGASVPASVRRQPSFSTTLMHENPVGGAEVLAVVRATGGRVLSVSDDLVREAMHRIGTEAGIWAEPAGAIAAAGLLALDREGALRPGERIVCLVSGSGANQPEATAGYALPPPAHPGSDEFRRQVAVLGLRG